MKYIPGLDGIRALSAVAVIFFHLGIPIFGLGWTGVDCFFVLSGFLITGILIESKNSAHYFRNFYIKRSLRIFPIYYLIVIIVFLLFEYNHIFVKSIVYYITYTQNFFFLKAGYASIPSLAHTWSLAVEEQFYLLWPLIIWKLSIKKIAKLSFLLIITAFLFRTICSITESNVYMQNSLLFSHMDGLAFGALLSCLLRLEVPKERIFNWAKFILIFLFFIGLIFTTCYSLYIANNYTLNTFLHGIYKFMEVFSSKTLLIDLPFWNFIYTLIALFYVCLIAFVTINTNNFYANTFRAVLETKLLRHLGKISYGLYLYHLPCFYIVDKHFINENSSPILSCFLKIIFTYLIALISWHFIESKLNSLKKQFHD